MYLAMTRTPDEIKGADGKTVTMHMLFVQYVDDNQEIVPVFLSKLHAYMYLKPAGLLEEFQLVSPDSAFLAPYRGAAKQAEKSSLSIVPGWCQIGLGIIKQENEYKLSIYGKRFSLYELFFSAEKIQQEVVAHLGDYYQIIVDNNRLSDEEIVAAAEKLINPSTEPRQSNNLITKLGHKLKTAFSKQNNHKIEKQNTDILEEHKKEIEQIVEQNFSENVGSSYGFFLKNKDGTLYAPKEHDKHVIAVFINKLDAVIYSMVLYKKFGSNFDIIAFKSSHDPLYFKGITNGYNANAIQFRIIYGFLGASTPFGTKWASYEKSGEVPSMLASDCPLSDIENGIDLRFYFAYVQGAQEREIAMTGLIKTNLTPMEELKVFAKNIYADMKSNLVAIEKDSSKGFHRIISVGD